MSGEIHRKPEVIVNPENYEDMIKKLQEREKEQLEKVKARRKTDDTEELEAIASRSIVTRALRQSDYKPLKDLTVLREAKSEDILDLKKKLNEEINAIGKRILKPEEGAPPTEKKELKGRITTREEKPR